MLVRADYRAANSPATCLVGQALSPHANGAIGHDQQTTIDFELEKGREMTAHKGQDSASTRCGRAKDDDAMVVSRRVCPYICDSFVQSEKNPLLAPDVFEKNLVWRAGQSLVRNQIRIVAHGAEIIANFGGEILIDLEFHVA